MFWKICCVVSFAGIVLEVKCIIYPSFSSINRSWKIPESERVGSIVTQIQGSVEEGRRIIYGLEVSPGFQNKNSSQTVPAPPPFVIDPVTGSVYLVEALQGRAGQNIYLYVTVSDGYITTKNEVLVNILKADPKDFESKTNGSSIISDLLPLALEPYF